jgi:hypothetical protein
LLFHFQQLLGSIFSKTIKIYSGCTLLLKIGCNSLIDCIFAFLANKVFHPTFPTPCLEQRFTPEICLQDVINANRRNYIHNHYENRTVELSRRFSGRLQRFVLRPRFYIFHSGCEWARDCAKCKTNQLRIHSSCS